MTENSASEEPPDPQGMLGIVRDQPAQWSSALQVALDSTTVTIAPPRAVVVAGMGGSGIAGDIARLAADLEGTCPVVPVKGYAAPAWLDARTPVIAVSHSGNTEETLSLVDDAARVGAPVHVVTSGGALAARAEQEGWSSTIVAGGMQPRASLPSLVTPVLVTLQRWGVIDGMDTAIAALPSQLAPIVQLDVDGGGPDRSLASALQGHVGVFVGGRGVGALVAMRAACQVAENAEEKAFHAELPEFDHNALVGFATQDPSGTFVVVAIRDADEHPRVAARFAPTLAGVEPGVASTQELTLPPGGWLSRLAAGVLHVDLASVHLALALRRDPTPVDILVSLKHTLASAT